MSLVENREVAYEALFLGELPYNPQPNLQDIGLAGLWRAHTIKKGSNGDALNELLSAVPSIVTDTLLEHDAVAHSGDADGEAIFSFIDRNTLPGVANTTAQVVKLWEKALWRNGESTVIATSVSDKPAHGSVTDERLAHWRASRSLITETAAAVLKVLPVFVSNPRKPNQAESRNLARVLANWGPQFVTEWMDGSILSKWLEQQNLTDEQSKEWQDTITPGLRKYIAIGNTVDPLAALDKVKANLELMTDEVIADQLGWSIDEAKNIINPAIRKHFAVHNTVDPLAALDKVKANLELMTDEVIAERLGWSIDEAKNIINPAVRKYFAFNNTVDPLAALDKVKANLELMTDEVIADQLGWTANNAKTNFTPAMRKYFAVGNIADPLAAVQDYVSGKVLYCGKNFVVKPN